VEIALFFQAELEAAAGSSPSAAEDGAEGQAFSTVLLSADNAQLQMARTHGLPAAKLEDLAALPAALSQQQSLTAGLLRSLLTPVATAGGYSHQLLN